MNILEKKETKIIAVAVMVILIIIAGIMLFNQNNLKQTKDSLEHEAGKELAFDAQDYFDVDEETAAEITFDASRVDVNTVGEYKATASYKSKTYMIKVNVIDTTAPMVDFACRYVFTNDVANADISSLVEGVYDASEYNAKLIRFERSGNLSVMDEKALNALVDTINTHMSDEELKAIGTADLPTEPGIYRGIVEIADVHGNAAYEEVYVILDKTGAVIEDVADKTITVSAENLAAEPAVDKSEYHITDNVDGKIAADDITCELELRDEAKHEWLVHVSYTDRAGNENKADFLIIVTEGTAATQNGNGSASNNGGNTGNGGSSNQGSNSNSVSDKKPTNNQDTSTWVPTDDENVISPSQQMLIDAGYGNVVKFDTGNYGVLMKDGDHTINGLDGGDILRQYLAERKLEAGSIIGGWIDAANGWYMWTATNIHELITPDDEEFWD